MYYYQIICVLCTVQAFFFSFYIFLGITLTGQSAKLDGLEKKSLGYRRPIRSRKHRSSGVLWGKLLYFVEVFCTAQAIFFIIFLIIIFQYSQSQHSRERARKWRERKSQQQNSSMDDVCFSRYIQWFPAKECFI